MKLIFGDNDSIKYRDQPKTRPKFYRSVSECCDVYLNSRCDWEYPKDEMVNDYEISPTKAFGLMSGTRPSQKFVKARRGMTLITKCSGCDKESLIEKVPVY